MKLRAVTQEGKILEFLKKKGRKGATNYELNQLAMRYGGCIHRLRNDGHLISTIQISQGTFMYYLNEEQS